MSAPDLIFDPATHTYTYRGITFPSVTQVLKETGLIDDRWYSEAARIRGQAVHLATEYDDRGVLDESTVSPIVRPYLAAWRRFRAETGFAPTEIERRVSHPTAQYGGTLDRLGALGSGALILLDIKTGGPQRWHALQLAAYAMALPEPRKYRRARVELRGDGTYRFSEFPAEDLSADYSIFSQARTTWQFQARRL